MKTKTNLLSALVLFAFACGHDDTGSSEDNLGELSCFHEVMLVCPSGQVDGCMSGETTVHRCVDEGVSCAREIALQCEPGQVDGCLTGETDTHRCVADCQPMDADGQACSEPTPCENVGGTCFPGKLACQSPIIEEAGPPCGATESEMTCCL